ncbi:hypothetical protein AG1IA_02221 [Rhizoctonia solani AG-1 IA]|uniref:Uncharacterized protein n=1 Tax=Thanatephorus cucumeris (strain AG1-IA) TaxID=983506 RepID=L8X3Q8_THACA|nr:hypothetical protein AG1IA_02221 [Rhizoctonia solani AG-1 IA]
MVCASDGLISDGCVVSRTGWHRGGQVWMTHPGRRLDIAIRNHTRSPFMCASTIHRRAKYFSYRGNPWSSWSVEAARRGLRGRDHSQVWSIKSAQGIAIAITITITITVTRFNSRGGRTKGGPGIPHPTQASLSRKDASLDSRHVAGTSGVGRCSCLIGYYNTELSLGIER